MRSYWQNISDMLIRPNNYNATVAAVNTTKFVDIVSSLREINDEGQIYLTPTTIEKKYAIRFVTGTFESTEQDVELAYKVIKDKIVS